MKTVLYLFIGLLIVGVYIVILLSINQKETEDVKRDPIERISTQEITTESAREKRDSASTTPYSETSAQLTKFNGSWFSIEYPANFSASPTEPILNFNDYTFIETDEATFTSPDGTVEFFVFSPQWGGDPIDYLVEHDNEKTVDQQEQKANSDDPFAASHHWVTYEDKEGKYTRSYHSIMTESTHHVFGVKYTNRKMYEIYKADYLAFKKSLQQFAD